MPHGSSSGTIPNTKCDKVLFNMTYNFTRTKSVYPTDNTYNFVARRVPRNKIDGEANDNGRDSKSTGSPTIHNEANEEGVDEEVRLMRKCQKCGKHAAMLPPCKHISKAYARKPIFLSHKLMPTGGKPFCRPTFHRAFVDQSNLRPHLQTHMEAKRCHYSHCTASFSHWCLLTQHLAKCPLSLLATATSTANTTPIIGAINTSA
ncbi:Zinc finger protein SNAI2 [Taenia solium]|eukprot:TsM_001118200 transcript=TsM_001118200 gene=TsM_001118200